MRHTDFSAYGGNIYDSAGTALAHRRHDGESCVQRGPEKYVQRFLVVLDGHRVQRADCNRPSVVYQNIDFAEFTANISDSLLHLIAITHVAGANENCSLACQQLARALE